MKRKYLNKQLLTIGAGTLGAMFAAATGSNLLKSKTSGVVNKYAVPITGAGLVVAGSMLMSEGSADMKKAGMGIGGVGVSILGNEGYKAISNTALQGTPRLNGSTGGNPPTGDNVVTV